MSYARCQSFLRLRAAQAILLAMAVFVAVDWAAADPVAPAKRPLTHADYDGWKSIQQPTLSRDGSSFAYNLMPAEGDGEFVVRNVATGGEHRVARGPSRIGQPAAGEARPATTEEEYEDEDQRRQPGAGPAAGAPAAEAPNPLANAAHHFSPDGKLVVFPLVPTKTETDKARAEKKTPAEMPRPVIAVMDVATGNITAKIERANSFTVVGEGSGLLVYRRQARPADRSEPVKEEKKEAPAPEKKEEKKESPTLEKKDEKPAPRAPTRTYGTDLVLRNLADCTERTLEDVSEYTITRDGKTLVYAVSSKKEETDGVYAVTELPRGEAAPLVTGKGKYSKLTWDEKQKQLVFFTDKDDAAAAKPKAKLYHWDRQAVTKPVAEGKEEGKLRLASATDLLPPMPNGIHSGWSITDRGTISFSADGTKLYVSTGPEREEPPAPAPTGRSGPTTPQDEKAVFDLWHYKDEQIQPMQKVRGAAEANRSYRAVFHLGDKQFRQLADENIEVTPQPAGDWAVGIDTRPYRKLTGYGATLSDYSLVNVRTGESAPLMHAAQWQPNLAHDGKHLAYFDGKDWHAAPVPLSDGKDINLTAKLPVKFVVEEWDQPSEPPAYGFGGWSSDGKYVLLDDRYDVWKVAVDGSEAKMLTAGLGRKTQTTLRIIRDAAPGRQGRGTTPGSEEPEHGTDLSKPVLLKAVNENTRDEGFYRVEPGASEPKLLVMGARAYGNPIKAKDADTYLLTISTFFDSPDYYVTGADFREFKRVTDANPQKNNLLWGKAELVRYKNSDGVELSGMLIKPENFDPNKKYPMMVYIYERLSQSLHRFVPPSAGTSINASYYASNGYLVFMPDIVYTIGSPGQSAMKCVLPGIQAVVDKGYVDEKAIGIQGHSWGGYQIAYLVTQTTRFKAAAAGAPVSDMVSAYDGIRWGTGLPRQFQYERTQSRLGATLWQAPQKYIENSPIFMADRVQTPLLMLHNDGDDAVPWYQGIEYYLALRRLGKECYLFNYIGEPHGLRKKANQKDYTVRMQEFFDYHLKGRAKPEWMEKGIPYKPRPGDRPAIPMPMGPTVTEEKE